VIKSYGDTNFLTGMRAYAAIAVVLTHAGGGGLLTLGEMGKRLVDFGGQGVAVFFVISGYSVSSSFIHSKGFGDYINKRFWRIAPLYYFWIVVAILMGTTAISWQIKNEVSLDMYNLFMHITFLSCLDYRIAPTLLGVDWTLSIEMFWYFLVPALLLWAKGLGRLIAIMVGSSLIYILVLTGRSLLPLSDEDAIQVVHWSPFPYMIAFCLGIVAFRLRELSYDFARWGNVALVFLLLILLIYLLIPISIVNHTKNLFFMGASFILILFGSMGNKSFRLIFANRVILLLGTLSYGIYLSHMTVLGIMGQVFAENNLALIFLLTLSISIVVSTFAYYVIELNGSKVGQYLYHYKNNCGGK